MERVGGKRNGSKCKSRGYCIHQTGWNAARCIRTDEELIQEWKVTRIGRKYIYAKRQGDVRDTCFEFFEGYRNMHPGRWVEKSEMVPDYLLYFSKQEIEEEIQKESLGSKIQIYAKYDVFKLSLDQMRKMNYHV